MIKNDESRWSILHIIEKRSPAGGKRMAKIAPGCYFGFPLPKPCAERIAKKSVAHNKYGFKRQSHNSVLKNQQPCIDKIIIF